MEKPRIVIFKNKKAGEVIIRNGSPVEINGRQLVEADLNAKINLPDDLSAGEYEVSIYKNTAKNGAVYYSGNIKPSYKQNSGRETNNNFNAKEFVRKAKETHDSFANKSEDFDDSVPF